jgi:hypothetical protein
LRGGILHEAAGIWNEDAKWGGKLGQEFFHDDKFAGDFWMEDGRKRDDFEEPVTEAFVVRAERRDAGAERAEPDCVTAGVAGEAFGLSEDFFAEAGALLVGSDGKETQVAASVGAVWFEVDAGEEILGGVRVFVEEELSFCHVVADAGVVDAIVVEDGALDDEGGVDKTRDGGDVGVGG